MTSLVPQSSTGSASKRFLVAPTLLPIAYLNSFLCCLLYALFNIVVVDLVVDPIIVL